MYKLVVSKVVECEESLYKDMGSAQAAYIELLGKWALVPKGVPQQGLYAPASNELLLIEIKEVVQ